MTPDGFLRHRIALQAVLVLLVALAAGAMCAFDPGSVTERLGAIAVILGLGVAAVPREPLPTGCLLLLIVQYAEATPHLGSVARLTSAVLLAVILYTIHTSAELLGVVPKKCLIEWRMLSHVTRTTLAVAAAGSAMTVVMVEVGLRGPNAAWTVPVSLSATVVLLITLVMPLRGRQVAPDALDTPPGDGDPARSHG